MKKPEPPDPSKRDAAVLALMIVLALGMAAAFISVLILAIFRLVNHWTATPALIGLFS